MANSKTPGMLNPDAFSSDLEMRKEMFKQGVLAGWTPLAKAFKRNKTQEKR